MKNTLERRISKLERILKNEQEYENVWSDGEWSDESLSEAEEVKDNFKKAVTDLKYAMQAVTNSTRRNRDATFQFRDELLDAFNDLKDSVDSYEGYFVIFKNKSKLTRVPK